MYTNICTLFFFSSPFTVSVPYKKRFYPQMLLLSFFLLTLFPQSLCEKFTKTLVNTSKTNGHQLLLLDNKFPPSNLFLQSPHLLNTKKQKYCSWGLASRTQCTRERSYPVTVSIIHALLHTFRHSSQSHSSSINLHLIIPLLLALISTITSFQRQKIPFYCG